MAPVQSGEKASWDRAPQVAVVWLLSGIAAYIGVVAFETFASRAAFAAETMTRALATQPLLRRPSIN
jgi:hypothetical protein